MFDRFLADHYDEETQNFLIQSYVPEGSTGNFSGAGSNAYTINVSFLGIFEVLLSRFLNNNSLLIR